MRHSIHEAVASQVESLDAAPKDAFLGTRLVTLRVHKISEAVGEAAYDYDPFGDFANFAVEEPAAGGQPSMRTTRGRFRSQAIQDVSNATTGRSSATTAASTTTEPHRA